MRAGETISLDFSPLLSFSTIIETQRNIMISFLVLSYVFCFSHRFVFHVKDMGMKQNCLSTSVSSLFILTDRQTFKLRIKLTDTYKNSGLRLLFFFKIFQRKDRLKNITWQRRNHTENSRNKKWNCSTANSKIGQLLQHRS